MAVMQEPSAETCFPYSEISDSTCAVCGCWVMNDQRVRHVDWHIALYSELQPAPEPEPDPEL